MSTVVTKNVQVGTSGTAAQNFTLYQPASPDGTVRLANGNSGTTTDLVTVTSAGNVGIGTSSPVQRLTIAGGIGLFGGAGVSGNAFYPYYNSATSYNAIGSDGSGGMTFITGVTAPSVRATIDNVGMFVPGANATYDLGSTSLRWRNVYTSDLHLSNGIGNYTIVEGEEDLFLYNNKNGKTYKFALIEVDQSEAPPKMKEA
jgi:hypothetical protein